MAKAILIESDSFLTPEDIDLKNMNLEMNLPLS